jgi:hypothetical protein
VPVAEALRQIGVAQLTADIIELARQYGRYG